MMKSLACTMALAALSLIMASGALAQNSNFGTINLRPGFSPDPWGARGTSGGASNASHIDARCSGWISGAPDHVLKVQSHFGFLRIFAESSDDTTLVIQTPRGQVLCNDDAYGLNPSVEGRFPAGTYRVWVGSYTQGESSSYRLGVTELRSVEPGSGHTASGSRGLDHRLVLDARRGNFDPVRLRSGFTPDPLHATGVSGGQFDGSRLGSECRGWIAGQPDHIMTLRGDLEFFRVFASSREDTTLIIRAPNGRFFCNDDTDGVDPAIERNHWRRGTYRIWVGSYREGESARYELGFSELPAEGDVGRVRIDPAPVVRVRGRGHRRGRRRAPDCREAVLAAGHPSSSLIHCEDVDPYCAVAVINAGHSPASLIHCDGVDRRCAVSMMENGRNPSEMVHCE